MEVHKTRKTRYPEQVPKIIVDNLNILLTVTEIRINVSDLFDVYLA